MIINNTTPQANTPNGTDPNYGFLNLQFSQAATARLILSFFFGHSLLWNFACWRNFVAKQAMCSA
jgi:hypothetical protein